MTNDPKERKELFGAKKSWPQIIRACQVLLEEIGERPDSGLPALDNEEALRETVEELVHEMAHHVVLLNSVDFTENRGERIGSAIDLLTPAQQAGNEIDTLAIELEALWWLYLPLNQAKLVRSALGGMNIEISRRAISRAVKHLRNLSEIALLGKGLAWVILEEVELQKREADANPSP